MQEVYCQIDLVEFLTVWRQIVAGEEINFTGEHLHIEGGKLLFVPIQKPYPPLWFGGSSVIAQRVAAKHVDVYLTWGEPPDHQDFPEQQPRVFQKKAASFTVD